MSLIADIFQAQLIDDTGAIFATSTLQTADIDVKVTESEVRGGRANALIAILHSNRDISVKLADVTFRKEWIAKQLGKTISTGAVTAWAEPKWYTAATTTGVTISLDQTPLTTNSGIAIYKADGTLIAGTAYTVATKTVTFTTGVVAGDVVEVRGYKYTTGATAETISIDNTSFGDGVKLILTTLEIDEDETPLANIQWQFDEALPSGSFTFNTKKERDAIVQNMDLRIIKPKTSTEIGRVIRIPLS
jgi:hypothetical protein